MELWLVTTPFCPTPTSPRSHTTPPGGSLRILLVPMACVSHKMAKKGLFSDRRRRRRLWEKGLLLSCPMPFRGRFSIFLCQLGVYILNFSTPFRGRFWHQGLRHLGSNFEVLGRAWLPLQSASDPPRDHTPWPNNSPLNATLRCSMRPLLPPLCATFLGLGSPLREGGCCDGGWDALLSPQTMRLMGLAWRDSPDKGQRSHVTSEKSLN